MEGTSGLPPFPQTQHLGHPYSTAVQPCRRLILASCPDLWHQYKGLKVLGSLFNILLFPPPNSFFCPPPEAWIMLCMNTHTLHTHCTLPKMFQGIIACQTTHPLWSFFLYISPLFSISSLLLWQWLNLSVIPNITASPCMNSHSLLWNGVPSQINVAQTLLTSTLFPISSWPLDSPITLAMAALTLLSYFDYRCPNQLASSTK
jgi:hypothetical protein